MHPMSPSRPAQAYRFARTLISVQQAARTGARLADRRWPAGPAQDLRDGLLDLLGQTRCGHAITGGRRGRAGSRGLAHVAAILAFDFTKPPYQPDARADLAPVQVRDPLAR